MFVEAPKGALLEHQNGLWLAKAPTEIWDSSLELALDIEQIFWYNNGVEQMF
jgi:hypothetical protein